MWNTQEDVWLTRAILNAIKKVNSDAGATKISDAPIRTIESLVLRGGSRETAEAGAAPSGGGDDYSGGMDDYDGGGVSQSQFSGDDYDGGGGGGGGITFTATIKTDLDSVFGSDSQAVASTSDDDGGGGGGLQAKRRYVDDDPALPYKTRGFYIEVYMLHDKLPDFQAALVSMPWPTELLMIQQVSDKTDVLKKVETTGSKIARPGTGRPGGFNTTPGVRPGFGGRPAFGGKPRTFGGGPKFGGASGGYNPGGGGFGRSNQFTEEETDYGSEDGGGGPGFFNNLDPQSDTSSGAKAMKDFYLAKIGIAGLMTIYRSPEEREVATEEPTVEKSMPFGKSVMASVLPSGTKAITRAGLGSCRIFSPVR
jgi:hypothetical protein